MPFYIYITTTRNNTALYTGVANDLRKRVAQHKQKTYSGFSSRYNVNKLVYYEIFSTAKEAIIREKQIKAGSRQKKIDLIRRMNSRFEDLTPKL